MAAIVVAASSRLARTGQDAAVVGGANGRPEFLLFTSLPIYWSEAPDLATTLHENAPPHWARVALQKMGSLVPVDALESETLGAPRRLLMIQPRPLAPAENVALDAWIGQGGRLLLFADPRLTAESAFGLGDRRRPQDIVLLSPILARWGLALEFDQDQAAGERAVALDGQVRIPTNLAGRFALVRGGRNDARCALQNDALVAECAIGAGRLVAVADAALFESASNAADSAARAAALETLLARLD